MYDVSLCLLLMTKSLGTKYFHTSSASADPPHLTALVSGSLKALGPWYVSRHGRGEAGRGSKMFTPSAHLNPKLRFKSTPLQSRIMISSECEKNKNGHMLTTGQKYAPQKVSK